MDIPFLAELLEKVMNLIVGAGGNDADMIAVFKALIEFFGGLVG